VKTYKDERSLKIHYQEALQTREFHALMIYGIKTCDSFMLKILNPIYAVHIQ